MDILERRQEIAANPTVPVKELAERFGVSESTVYRDRRELALRGDNGAEQFAATPDVTSGLQFSRFKQISTSGVEFHGGQVTEEFQRELQDDGGVKLYTEMSMHPVTSAVLFAIEMAIRQVEWMAEPASDKPRDKKKAEFLDQCREDMSQTWDDIVGQSVRPTLIYGFNLAELVYKKRLGMKPPAYTKDPGKSRYNDGLIGWRRWQFVSPRSMPAGNRWQFDENGRVQAFRQQPAPDYQMRKIPMEKALLFRSSMLWDNPEPPGILRYMYRAWYYATNMQEIEAIGAERLGVGLPLIYLGDGCSMEGANSDYQQALDIVRNVRADEQMGVVIPKPKILADGRGMLFELASPPSQGLVDFNKVIERYENRMAMTVLAQFIFNGMLQVGSYALNRSATDTFQMSVGAWVGMVADVINRFAVPRLFALNDKFGIEDLPQLTHTEVGVPDLEGIANFVNKLVQSQALTVDDELEKYLRELARFPEMQEKEIEITPEKAAAETEEEGEEEVPETVEGETPEEGEGEAPGVEIAEQASESFALKTIRGALARESTTGKFARGGGQPLSDEEVALGDAVAFGKMTASQAKMLAGAGLLNLSGGAYKYTDKGRSLSRLMRREPRKGMDQLTALTKGKGIMVKLPKKGGGGKGKKAAGEQQTANREKVLGALADKGVDAAQIDALAALKEGGEADAEALAGMEGAGLVKTAEDGMVIMTSAGRSLLGAANSGDVDRARAAMVKAAEAKKRAAERAAKGAGKGKAGKAEEKEEKKPQKPTAMGRLEQAGLDSDSAKAFTLALGSADPDKAASAQDEEARAALVELGLFEELEDGGAKISAKGRELWRAMESGDWDKVEELLGEKMADAFPPFIDIIDESFALRLKRGGPKWERQTNQYEMALRSEYQAWADATAAQLAGTETQEEFDRVLDDRIDELVALLVLLGRRNLPEAHQLGLGGQLATPDGMGELAAAMGDNEGYIREKLGPAVADKMRQRVAEEPTIREDRDSLAAVLGTFLARAGSYAGAYWGLTQLGLADRARQAQAELKQRLVREEELTPVEAEEQAKIPVRWFLDPTVRVHCGSCLMFGNRTYASWDDMLAETGGIYPANGTDCDGNCRCSCSAGVDGEWRRVWTHLAEPGGGLPMTER